MLEYAEFMKGLISGPMPDFSYKIESITSNSNEVVFYATMTGSHTGERGPIPPSNPPLKTFATYVYRVVFNDELKVVKMTKCFDIYTAFSKLNWPLPK